ncbi:Single myb histone 6-like protein [Drosera capensis]
MQSDLADISICFCLEDIGFWSMGAPKQKWTAEEEAALRARVGKHESGKWQTILRDPEFSDILCSRSNVDAKARLAFKENTHKVKHEDKPVSLNNSVQDDGKNNEAIVPVTSSEVVQVTDPKRNRSRLDNIILEALITLKEPKGSDKNAIALIIEERFWAPANLKGLLPAKLKFMEMDRYRITPNLASIYVERNVPDGTQGDGLKSEKHETKIFIKPQVEAELQMMKEMTPQQVAAYAAQAVAEAEVAIAVSEAAARDAEAAEAEAEALKVFADAAWKAVKCNALRAC